MCLARFPIGVHQRIGRIQKIVDVILRKSLSLCKMLALTDRSSYVETWVCTDFGAFFFTTNKHQNSPFSTVKWTKAFFAFRWFQGDVCQPIKSVLHSLCAHWPPSLERALSRSSATPLVCVCAIVGAAADFPNLTYYYLVNRLHVSSALQRKTVTDRRWTPLNVSYDTNSHLLREKQPARRRGNHTY